MGEGEGVRGFEVLGCCLLAFCDVTPGSKNKFGVYPIPKPAGQNTGDNVEKSILKLWLEKVRMLRKWWEETLMGRTIFQVHCMAFSKKMLVKSLTYYITEIQTK